MRRVSSSASGVRRTGLTPFLFGGTSGLFMEQLQEG